MLVTADGGEHLGPIIEIGDTQVAFTTSIESIDAGGAPTTQVRVRVTNSDPMLSTSVAEGFVFVSAVCPILDRPG